MEEGCSTIYLDARLRGHDGKESWLYGGPPKDFGETFWGNSERMKKPPVEAHRRLRGELLMVMPYLV